jgi:hypothetical protein
MRVSCTPLEVVATYSVFALSVTYHGYYRRAALHKVWYLRNE